MEISLVLWMSRRRWSHVRYRNMVVYETAINISDQSETDPRTVHSRPLLVLSIFDNHVSGSFCPCYYHGKQNEKYQGIGQNKSFGTLTVELFNYKDHKRSLEWLRKTICISWRCFMFQLLLNCNRFSCDLSLPLLRNTLCELHL